MKKLNKENLIEVVNSFIQDKKHPTPMLIWLHSWEDFHFANPEISHLKGCATVIGHPFAGHQTFMLDGQIKLVADYPELLKEPILPGSYREDTSFFLYNRYLDQLNDDAISHVLSIAKNTELPLILLIIEHSKIENPSFDADGFDQYEFENDTNDIVEGFQHECLNITENEINDAKLLQKVMTKAMYPIIFHKNTKYDKGYEYYFINYGNVMDTRYTIDGSNELPNFVTEGEPIVSYSSAEELIADGWLLD